MNDSTEPGRTGDGFDDPTAPARAVPEPAPPTQPIPSEDPVAPPSPYAAPQVLPAPYGQNPYAQGPYQQQPYGQAPHQPQPHDPTAYGSASGQSPYAPSPYGSPFPAPPQPGQNTGALALTITSAVASALCCLLCVPALIFGIVALSKQSSDPVGSARMTRYGWVALGITLAVGILLVVGFVALAVAGAFEGSGSSGYGGL